MRYLTMIDLSVERPILNFDLKLLRIKNKSMNDLFMLKQHLILSQYL